MANAKDHPDVPRRRLIGQLLGCALVSLLPGPASGQDRMTGSNLDRLRRADLPRVDGEVTLYRSRGAEREGAFYGMEMSAASQWYRARLGWPGHLTVAVLDKKDFARITPIPYPSPHAEGGTGLIVIADHVTEHPGFEFWDIDERAINCAWSFHEIGHVIAGELGIASGNFWVNELIASVVMAAYVRAERPQYAGFQAGLPKRFSPTGRYGALSDFDAVYFAMGQWDYLWFHFHIARIADFMVADGDLAAVLAGLKREFSARRQDSTAETFLRLERIRPGVTAVAGPLASP